MDSKLELHLLTLLIIGLVLLTLANCKKTEEVSPVIITTAEITDVTPLTARSGGEITSDGGYQVIARGVCWSTKKKPTTKDNYTSNGSGTGSYESELTGLSIGPTYYIRAYATTEKGTAYGNEITYANLTGIVGSVDDIDGNTYKTIGIGSQVWMGENLRVTRYRSGYNLSQPGNNNYLWTAITTGVFAWFDNDDSWKNVYGALYDWIAVSDTAGICPEGWHVPGEEEWEQLLIYIGGEKNTAGMLLKSCRQIDSPLGGECNTSEHPRWDSNNTHHGTDEYSFDALPGGFRLYDGFFPTFLGSNSQWWTSTESSTENHSIARGLSYQSSALFSDKYDKKFGFSVRCVKD